MLKSVFFALPNGRRKELIWWEKRLFYQIPITAAKPSPNEHVLLTKCFIFASWAMFSSLAAWQKHCLKERSPLMLKKHNSFPTDFRKSAKWETSGLINFSVRTWFVGIKIREFHVLDHIAKEGSFMICPSGESPRAGALTFENFAKN